MNVLPCYILFMVWNIKISKFNRIFNQNKYKHINYIKLDNMVDFFINLVTRIVIIKIFALWSF